MSQNPYQNFSSYAPSVADVANADARATFLQKTYLHLLGAILAFAAICAFALTVFGAQIEPLVNKMTQGYAWLFVMGAWMAASYVAQRWAISNTSRSTQYFGLGLFVVAEAIIFIPLLFIAQKYFGDGLILSAGLLTAIIAGGLTVTVLLTKADFSFLRSAITIGGFAAIGLIACSIFVGFGLGMWFSVAMIILASGSMLYQTSNVLHHYNTEQYVAASLALFASVATIFWYAIRLLMYFSEE